jgi:hypothetical protein
MFSGQGSSSTIPEILRGLTETVSFSPPAMDQHFFIRSSI